MFRWVFNLISAVLWRVTGGRGGGCGGNGNGAGSTTKKRAVFITGCDSGFGYSLASHMLEDRKYSDFVVIAGCFFPNGKTEGPDKLRRKARNLSASSSSATTDSFHLLHIDVTSADSIQKAKRDIAKILEESDSQLWALVNNAATLAFGDAVFQTEDMFRKQFEVNVIGPWSLSKALVPDLIQSKGRIVNMISFCTTCPLPTLAVYTATKAALKRLSEGMRAELSRLGVSVVMFNPGDHPTKTPLCALQKANFQAMRPEVTANFKDKHPEMVEYFDGIEAKFCSNFPLPELQKLDDGGFYAEADKVLLDEDPAHFYVNSPWMTRLFFWVVDMLPSNLGDQARIAIMRLPEIKSSDDDEKEM